MNSTHKKLTLLTLLSVVSCGAVVFASIANLGPTKFASIGAATVNSSITFSGFSSVDNQATKVSSLANGGSVKAQATSKASSGDIQFSAGAYTFFTFENNGVENDSIEIDSTFRSFAPFENLQSISCTFSGGGEMTVYYSSNGSSFSSRTLSSNSSYSISNSKYVYLKSTGAVAVYVSSITLSYTCTGEGGGGGGGETSVASNLVSHGAFAMTCTQSSQIEGTLTFSSLTSGTIVVKNTNVFTAWTETQTFNWSISADEITVSFSNVSSPSNSAHAHLEASNALTVTFNAETKAVTALSLPLTNSSARTLVYSA